MLVEEWLDDILHRSDHNAQKRIRLVWRSVLEQVMRELCRQSVNGRILDAHISKFFDTNVAIDRISKTLLASSSFKVPIATYVQRGMGSTVVSQKHLLTRASKNSLMVLCKTDGDFKGERQSRLE